MGKKKVVGKKPLTGTPVELPTTELNCVEEVKAGNNSSGNGSKSNGSDGSVYQGQGGGWQSYELVASSVRTFKNPMGKDVKIRAELRIPDGRNFLRASIGRSDTRSPIGLSRQIFFEDIPFAIEALIDIYEQGKERYITLETSRIRRNLERDLDGIEDVVSHDRDDWHGRIMEIKRDMLGRLPGGESEC